MTQYEMALEKVKAQNASDVASAQVEYREAYDRLQRYQKTIVPQSAKSRSAVAFAFEKGSATLVDLLRRNEPTTRCGWPWPRPNPTPPARWRMSSRPRVSFQKPPWSQTKDENDARNKIVHPADRPRFPGCTKDSTAKTQPLPEPVVNSETATVSFATNAPQLSSITVEAVQPRTQAVSHVTGRLYWDDEKTVRVFTPVAGRVIAIRADLGQNLTNGSPLAEIDSPDFGQALASARTAVGNLAAAEKTFRRSQELIQHAPPPKKTSKPIRPPTPPRWRSATGRKRFWPITAAAIKAPTRFTSCAVRLPACWWTRTSTPARNFARTLCSPTPRIYSPRFLW